MVRYFELAVESGVRVMSVESGSPASEAGIAEGDVIVAWDGKPVSSIDELHRLLTEAYLHTSAEVVVLRRSQKLTRAITPVELR
jgi:S1-C subfamily serine protease